ncbi:thiolase family protein [Bacillus sp. AGMB 02131]|uniref:Thiolase family protein n=1 Tax=Peribacillus faecalis TaxID=2772559 RepID=A0A927D140_9BACI|nr:thiolase family protein [Peribacillus faecalis]MBD3109109.1 thiolase family protein [Peribacillus faecalis]
MREAVIVEMVRTPVGRKNGHLKSFRPDELAALVIAELVSRSKVDPLLIEDVILGCVSQVGEQAGDIARVASLIAGLPIEVPGVTIDRQCGSSQQAVHFAAQAILSGDMDIVIAGGVESMSRIPIGSNYLDAKLSQKLTGAYEIIHQGMSAERIARKYQLTREDLDLFSFNSHQKALRAIEAGVFNEHIIPCEVEDDEGDQFNFRFDSGPREDTSLQKLSQLRPAFKEDGLVTAGNSSQISDGAAALLIMEKSVAERLGFTPKFRIHTRVVIGSDPTYMLLGPIPATEKALFKAGLSVEDIDVFEINEAFASVVLAWQKETNVPDEKINPYGGAIALGHPLGASGARLMITMLQYLEKTGGRYGLQAMCEGNGMANATIIERLE